MRPKFKEDQIVFVNNENEPVWHGNQIKITKIRKEGRTYSYDGLLGHEMEKVNFFEAELSETRPS